MLHSNSCSHLRNDDPDDKTNDSFSPHKVPESPDTPKNQTHQCAIFAEDPIGSEEPKSSNQESWYSNENGNSILLGGTNTRVWIHAQARLPTAFGHFDVFAFRTSRDEKEHIALVKGAPAINDVVPVRIHSECLTGDVLSSLRCDCQAQLRYAQAELGRDRLGVLVYLRQEGRGIGLANKIAAYALQDQGLDTVEANEHLGFDDDLRTYDIAAGILHLLGVSHVSLYTNNPRKVFGLKGHGIEVVEMRPVRVGQNSENASYLAAKKNRSGHLL